MSSPQPLLAARGAGRRFGPQTALAPTDLEVRDGETLALIGPNGAGKSTLLRIVLGLLAPQAGRVELFGSPPRRLPDRWRLGYVPQRPRLAPDLPATVEEVVAAGRLAKQGWWRRARPADRDAIAHALESVALDGLRSQRVAELSGGQQQRVLIAKALVSGNTLDGDRRILHLIDDEIHHQVHAGHVMGRAFRTDPGEERVEGCRGHDEPGFGRQGGAAYAAWEFHSPLTAPSHPIIAMAPPSPSSPG